MTRRKSLPLSFSSFLYKLLQSAVPLVSANTVEIFLCHVGKIRCTAIVCSVRWIFCLLGSDKNFASSSLWLTHRKVSCINCCNYGSVQRTAVRLFHRSRIFLFLFFGWCIIFRWARCHFLGTILHLVLDFRFIACNLRVLYRGLCFLKLISSKTSAGFVGSLSSVNISLCLETKRSK